MWDEVIKDVIEIVVLVVTGLIGRYVIPWLKEQLGNSKFQAMETFARIFVESAENTIVGEKTGADKKKWVSSVLAEKAQEKHLNLTEKDIEALIETAVNNMKREEQNAIK